MSTKIHAVQVLSDGWLMGFSLCGRRRVPEVMRPNAAALPSFVGSQGDRCGLCLRALNGTRSYGAPDEASRALII